MVVLDTNTVLQCILQDNEDMAALVDDQMAREECMIFPEIVAEIVFVRLKVYRLDCLGIEKSVSTIAL